VAIFPADCKVGIGAVLRDNAGQFIAAASDWYMEVMTAAEAEAGWSLLKGLQWIASYNYQHVILELDCQQVVNDVCTNNQIVLNMV
jgi:ribonuclease HI